VTTLMTKNLFFTPFYAAWVLGQPLWTFLRAAVPGVITTAVIGTIAATLASVNPIASWRALITVATVASMVFPPLVWDALEPAEKNLVRQLAVSWKGFRRPAGRTA
jgi:hypothetical protein